MANPWDDAYSQYSDKARSGDITADFIRDVYGPLGGNSEKGNSFADRVIAIHEELLAQNKKYKVPVSGGQIGEADTVWDTAFRLAETGTDSIYDLGERYGEDVTEEFGPRTAIGGRKELYHKPTGAAVKMPNYGFKNDYKLQFGADGTPVAYSIPKRSDWVEFRDDFLKPAVTTIGSFIPGVGPYIAMANAAYAASKGDWEKALLAGLSAAVPLAGELGASAQTVDTLNNIRQSAAVLKALEEKDLLGVVLGGADLSGVTELGGYDIKDVRKAVGVVTALQSEDPMAIIKAGAGYLPQGGTGGIDGPNPKDFEPGSYEYNQIFDPNTAGSVDPSDRPAESNYDPDTKGYFDELTGRFIPDEGGALTFGQLTNETSGTNIGSMDDYKYNPDTGNWTLPDGTEIDTSYMQNSQTPLTGQQLLNNAGAGNPKTPSKPTTPQKPGTPPKPGTPANPSAGVDMNQLMSLLGGGQQAAPTVVSSGQDNSADVQLMEDIFGTTMSAPPAGDPVTQARELARLLRS
jgi:hypothetical protein